MLLLLLGELDVSLETLPLSVVLDENSKKQLGGSASRRKKLEKTATVFVTMKRPILINGSQTLQLGFDKNIKITSTHFKTELKIQSIKAELVKISKQ